MTEYVQANWVLLLEVFQPDEAQLILGLLQMAGIPCKLERESAADLYGLRVGPLARIGIYVPEINKADAERIIAGDYEAMLENEPE